MKLFGWEPYLENNNCVDEFEKSYKWEIVNLRLMARSMCVLGFMFRRPTTHSGWAIDFVVLNVSFGFWQPGDE